MRVKLRSPAGTKVVTLDPDATVGDLVHAIRDASGLESFSVKLGFPPTPLLLDGLEEDIPLSQTGLKINGEQLTISSDESSSAPSSKPEIVELTPSRQPDIVEVTPSSNKRQKTTPPSREGSPDYVAIAAAAFSGKGPEQGFKDPSVNDPLSVSVPHRGGRLVLRVMPDDNSCLFRAVGTCFLPELDSMNLLRQAVREAIEKDPVTYTEAFLGKPRQEYIQTIMDDQSWGGAIELSILSEYFDAEICSIDVKTLRFDQFDNKKNLAIREGAGDSNPDILTKPRQRCFVVYSGIHYDCIAFVPNSVRADGDASRDTRVFDTDEDDILQSAHELCKLLRDRGYYTDVAGFTIRCNDCGRKFKGEKQAIAHGNKTSHYNFEQVS